MKRRPLSLRSEETRTKTTCLQLATPFSPAPLISLAPESSPHTPQGNPWMFCFSESGTAAAGLPPLAS